MTIAEALRNIECQIRSTVGKNM